MGYYYDSGKLIFDSGKAAAALACCCIIPENDCANTDGIFDPYGPCCINGDHATWLAWATSAAFDVTAPDSVGLCCFNPVGETYALAFPGANGQWEYDPQIDRCGFGPGFERYVAVRLFFDCLTGGTQDLCRVRVIYTIYDPNLTANNKQRSSSWYFEKTYSSPIANGCPTFSDSLPYVGFAPGEAGAICGEGSPSSVNVSPH